MTPDGLRGAVITLNGDRWTVVDVAPAEPLAEMVAAILEEEGIITVVRGADPVDDVFSHLGAGRVGTTVVLVPEADTDRALRLIADTVTDYQGEELDRLLASGDMEAGGRGAAEALGDDAAEEDSDDTDANEDEDEDGERRSG